MADYSALKQTIDSNVNTNGQQAITGAILNDVLNEMVDVLGEGYTFLGVATISTTPTTPEGKAYYLAGAAGTYSNFGNIVVNDDEVALLVWNGTAWSKVNSGAAKKEVVDAMVSATPTYAWTDTPSANSAIKELYLEGLKPNKYYYFRYLCKGDAGADLIYIRECDDAQGTNPILVIRTIDSAATNGILRLEAYNGSGISGYLIKNITSPAQWVIIEAYINKPVVSNVDYSPRIKEELDKSGILSEVNTLSDKVDDAMEVMDSVIIQNVNALESLPQTAGKYYTHSAGNWSDGQNVAGYATRIPILAGETYYYRNLYAYFCGQMTTDNQWVVFSNEQALAADGSFTATKDGELRISINTTISGLPLLTKSKEMYDENIYETYYSINALTGNQRIYHIGSGREYTTLRAGIAEAIQYPRSIVYVDAETFDLTQEFAAEIAAAGTTQYGIELGNGVHVIFSPGAVVNALYQGTNANVVKYFAPFYSGIMPGGFTLEGLTIFAKNTRYCVHDEYGGADVKDIRNRYINCKMEYDGTTSPYDYYQNCIGGGTAKHTYAEIINCYFDTYGTMGEKTPVSYHNSVTDESKSTIILSNCYFAHGTFRLGYYGPSTLKSRAFVNNCSFTSAPFIRAENASAQVENWEMVEFMNEIRN